MPYSVKQIKEFVPKKGRYDNVNREDPAQNNVLANMRLLYDAPEESAFPFGYPDLRKALKEAMDAADGKLPEAQGDDAIGRIGSWTDYITRTLDPQNDPDKFIKGEEKQKQILALIGHVNAGLEIDPPIYKPTEAQKKAAADKRKADEKAVGENKDIEAQEAAERLKQQAAQSKSAAAAPLNGRKVLDELIAKGKALPKKAQKEEDLEAARELCLDIMATRRTVNAQRNQPKLLNRDFKPADRDKWKEDLKKSTSLKRFLNEMSYEDLRRLASDGHGGALEDIVREEVRRMSLENKGGALVDADKRYAPTYAERKADLSMLLQSNKLTKEQKLERAVESLLLSQREDAGEKGARIGDIASLNKEASRTAGIFKSAANSPKEYNDLIADLTDPDRSPDSK